MSDYNTLCRFMKAKLSTALRRIDYPIHQGKPNPLHGKIHFVGSVPVECHKKYYDTEEDAIAAAKAVGVERMQRCDCSWVELT